MSTTSNVLIKELYPIVDKHLKDKSSIESIKKLVNDFIDRNNEDLTTIGPTNRVLFTESDKDKFYNIIGITQLQIKNSVKKSTYIKSSWVKSTAPILIAITLSIRFAIINKNDQLRYFLLAYFALALYPTLHYRSFRYGTNENIMAYTINNLSNKYKIKQLGSIYQGLIFTVQGNHDNYSKNLVKGTDKAIADYINGGQTRIGSMLKYIAREYYKNYDNQNYLNLEEDKVTEDEFKVSDSNVFSIDKITNQVALKLLVDGPSIKIIDLSAKLCSVSVNELRNYIQTVVVDKYKEDMRKIIENILFLYLFDEHNKVNEINSNKFMIYCLELYRKSNTTNKNIISIKSILDRWLEDVGIYKKTQRLATINDFRRAIFLFFVFTIQKVHVK